MLTLILATAIWERFAVGFGVATAILLIGGSIVLRLVRSRQQFILMRAAIEKGMPAFPAGLPPWIISMRQGLMILTLGIGVAAAGAGVWVLADHIEVPQLSATQPSLETLVAAKPRDEQGRLRPEGRLYSLFKTQWERAQTQRTVGMALVGSGGVLVLLGAARMFFARVERAYAADPEAQRD